MTNRHAPRYVLYNKCYKKTIRQSKSMSIAGEKQNVLNRKSTGSKEWEWGMLNSNAAYTLLCPPPPPRNRFPWHTDVIDNHAKEQCQANRRNHPRTPQIRIHVALIEPYQ
jgi:hypothetical protein